MSAEFRDVRNICATADVVVTCGTGGVGKTSVAAALGVLAARNGRRVVVITIDPARRLADAIGLSEAVGNTPVRVPLDAEGQLWITMLDVQETFDSLVRETSPSKERTEAVLNNSFYRSMSRSLSGTRDYMAAERLYELHNDPRFDMVIVDTPPSRSALDFLESPERLARFLKHPLVKLLIAPSRGGLKLAGAAMQPVLKAISSVVGSDALQGAVAFLQAFDGMEDEFGRRALAVAELLRGRGTAFAVVCSPSPDAVNEADYFVRQLFRLGVPMRMGILNRMRPDFGPPPPDASENVARVMTRLRDERDGALKAVVPWQERAAALFPEAIWVGATERPTDIHDLQGIVTLADELAANHWMG